ncbi:MAG: hypothetical protein ACRD8Z_23225 [Nitrososphaeraceae archaeon]
MQHNMTVIHVTFAKEHKAMLAHCKKLIEYQNGYMAIHPSFNRLIIALRTAVENGKGVLDKEVTSHDDLLNAFRLSLSVLKITSLSLYHLDTEIFYLSYSYSSSSILPNARIAYISSTSIIDFPPLSYILMT